MSEPPVESRFKYGRDQFDDIDADDLAGFLSGGGADPGAQPDLPRQTEVDEDVLREAGDPDRHYGGLACAPGSRCASGESGSAAAASGSYPAVGLAEGAHTPS